MKRALTTALLSLITLTAIAPQAGALDLFGIYWDRDHSEAHGYGGGFKNSRPLTRTFSWDGRVSYVDFADSHLSVIPLESTLIGKLGRFVYLGIGYGYYIFNGDGAPNNDFGWYYLAGLAFPLKKVGIFGEIRWLKLSADIDNPAPGTPGSLDLDSQTYHAGVSLNLAH